MECLDIQASLSALKSNILPYLGVPDYHLSQPQASRSCFFVYTLKPADPLVEPLYFLAQLGNVAR